jgi:branched-chain amino acid transport system permease protein
VGSSAETGEAIVQRLEVAPSVGRRGVRWRRLWSAVIAVASLAAVLALPEYASGYTINLAATIGIYATVNMAWNLLFGYAGVFSFGQLGFFALGAYGSVLSVLHWGLSPWLGMWFGGVVAAVAGLCVGIPSLRLYGAYMVLFTLAFQLGLAGLVKNVWTDVTGGVMGLYNVPALTAGGADPLIVGLYASAGLAVFTYLVIEVFARMPAGLATRAFVEGRAQTEARGISLFQHRLVVFALSAFLTGVAGGLYAHFFSILTPSVLEFGLLVNLLAWMVMGGVGTRLGPIVGTAVGVYLDDRLAEAQEYSQLVWGLILIGVVALAPGGIVAVVSSVMRRGVALGSAVWRGEMKHLSRDMRAAVRGRREVNLWRVRALGRVALASFRRTLSGDGRNWSDRRPGMSRERQEWQQEGSEPGERVEGLGNDSAAER